MILHILNSGSSGNCYILESDTEALIIEAGLPFREAKKALDFNVRKIVGVICSHGHKDHSGYVGEYEKAGIKIFAPYTFSNHIRAGCGYMKPFRITDFALTDKDGHFKHSNSDGSECPCYGFYISHPDTGNLIYASDTEYVKYRFKGLNHILVEANHSKEFIERDSAKYTHQITGHMEIKTTCEFLKANNNPGLRNVVLLHLSSDSSDAEDFKARAEKVVKCPVYVAEKGLEISLDLVPF